MAIRSRPSRPPPDPGRVPAADVEPGSGRTGESRGGRRRLLLWLLAAAGLALLGRATGDALPEALERIRGLGPWAGPAFALLYALGTVLLVPGSLLTLGGGAIFGIAAGTLWVFTGATAGAGIAFFLARGLARRIVEDRITRTPVFAALDRAIAQNGGRMVFLLRLSPVFPFVLLNYLLGLTRVRPAAYLLASIGMLPGTLLYVSYGALAGELVQAAGGARERGTAEWALLLLGVVATAAVSAMVARQARRGIEQAAGLAAEDRPPGRSIHGR